MAEFKTWAQLKPDTPFNELFPDGRVPILSPLPIVPREQGAPHCYIVPGKYLTEAQLHGLAERIWRMWQPECASLEQAIEYIRSQGLPLKTDWFSSWMSIDQGLMLSMVELGEDLRQRRIDAGELDEDELDAEEEWGDSDLEAAEYY